MSQTIRVVSILCVLQLNCNLEKCENAYLPKEFVLKLDITTLSQYLVSYFMVWFSFQMAETVHKKQRRHQAPGCVPLREQPRSHEVRSPSLQGPLRMGGRQGTSHRQFPQKRKVYDARVCLYPQKGPPPWWKDEKYWIVYIFFTYCIM